MTPTRIIVHHSLTKDSETVSWGAIRKFHTEDRGWIDIGYHFGIELVGDHIETLLGRPETETGAHCKGYNSDSIGICVVGNYDEDEFDEERQRVLVSLLRRLMTTYGMPIKSIYGHREFNPHKSCPGENLFRWLQRVRNGYL